MSIVTDFVEIRQYFDAYNLDQQNSTQTVNQFENKATKVKGIFKTQIEGAQICSIDQQGCYDLKLDQSFGTVPNESNICICIGIGHSLRSTIEECISNNINQIFTLDVQISSKQSDYFQFELMDGQQLQSQTENLPIYPNFDQIQPIFPSSSSYPQLSKLPQQQSNQNEHQIKPIYPVFTPSNQTQDTNFTNNMHKPVNQIPIQIVSNQPSAPNNNIIPTDLPPLKQSQFPTVQIKDYPKPPANLLNRQSMHVQQPNQQIQKQLPLTIQNAQSEQINNQNQNFWVPSQLKNQQVQIQPRLPPIQKIVPSAPVDSQRVNQNNQSPVIQHQSNISPIIPHQSNITPVIQLQSNISPNIPPPDFILPMYQQQQQQQKLKQLPPQRIKPSAIAMNAPRQRNIQKDNNQLGNQLQFQNQQQYQQQQQFQYQPPIQSRLPPIGKIVPSAPIDSERVNPNAQQQQIAPIFGQYNNIPPQAPGFLFQQQKQQIQQLHLLPVNKIVPSAPFDSEHPNQDILSNNNFNIVDELK